MNALNAAQRMQMIEKFETLTMNEYKALNSEIEQLRQRVAKLEKERKENKQLQTSFDAQCVSADKLFDECAELRQRVAELEKELEQQLIEVRRAERERCAKLCEAFFEDDDAMDRQVKAQCASSIREME